MKNRLIDPRSGDTSGNRRNVTGHRPPTAGKHSSRKSEKLITAGMAYLGTPYRLGAKPFRKKEFDCSSFIQYLYNGLEVELPRTSRQQSRLGKRKKNGIHRGDILFFTNRVRRNKRGIAKIAHVGIALGQNKMLHSCRKEGVAVTDLSETITSKRATRWIDYYMFAKRL